MVFLKKRWWMTIKRWDMWSHETCAGLTMSTMTIWLKYWGQGAYMKTSFEFGNQEMYIGDIQQILETWELDWKHYPRNENII